MIVRVVWIYLVCFLILAADTKKSEGESLTVITLSSLRPPDASVSFVPETETLSTTVTSTPTLPSPLSLRFVSPREGGVVTLGEKSVVDLAITGMSVNASDLPLSDLYTCLDVNAESAKKSVELWPEQHEHPLNETGSNPQSGHLRHFRKSIRPHCVPATLQRMQFLRTSRLGVHQMFASLEKWALYSSVEKQRFTLREGESAFENDSDDPLFYVKEVLSKTIVTFQSELPSSASGNFGRLPYTISRPHCSRFTHFKFLLYPQQWLPSTQSASIYYTLLSHPLRTEDPAEACVLIGLSDVKAANQNKESLEATGSRLTRLPLWGNGENHIVFHYGDYSPGFDVQRAMIAASSFSHGPPFNKSFFNHKSPEMIPDLIQARSGYDIEMPMAFYRCGYGDDQLHLKKFSRFYKSSPTGGNGLSTESSVPSMDSRERPLLLTFKGALYDMPLDHPAYPRRIMRSIHNGRDVIIALHCWSVAPDCSVSSTNDEAKADAIGAFSDFSSKPTPVYNQMRNYSSASSALTPECYSLTQESQSYDFETLMLRSRFAAVLPGEGTHSYRLYEALQAGSIPVLLGRSARPLEGLIKWDEIAILQEDTSALALQYLEARLRLIPTSTLSIMQKRGRIVFEAHFSTLYAQMSSMFALLAHRFNDVNKMISQEAEAEKISSEGEQSILLGLSRNIRNVEKSDEAIEDKVIISKDVMSTIKGMTSLSNYLKSNVNKELHKETPFPDVFPTGTEAEKDEIEKRSSVKVDTNNTIYSEAPSEGASIESSSTLKYSSSKGSALQPSITENHSRLNTYSHLLIEGSKAVSQLAEIIGPVQRLQLTVLLLNNSITNMTYGSNIGEQIDINRSKLLLHEAYANLSVARLQIYENDNLLSSLSLSTVSPHIEWLNSATPSLIDRSLDHARPAVANIYSILSQVYGIVGEWRHAATAVHLLLLHYGVERGSQQQDADTKRARNTLFDLRRSSTVVNETLISRSPHGRLLDVLSDFDGLSETKGGFGLRGWGALAHFSGPAPLVSVGKHSFPFPKISSIHSDSYETHPSVVLPHVLLTANAAQRVADDYLLQQSLQLRLHSFIRENKVKKSRAHSLPLCPMNKGLFSNFFSSKNSSIAIVSICAYPKGSGNLTELSTKNLKAYCEHHGYDCFFATASLDTSRPTAWSKVLLVTHFLSKYEWIMWKDCDTFFMNRDTTVEDILVSAAKARDIVGKGVNRVLRSETKKQEVIPETRKVLEYENGREGLDVSAIKTIIFSSEGSVVETLGPGSSAESNFSSVQSITVTATANIIDRAILHISSKQQDVYGESKIVGYNDSQTHRNKNSTFDESMCTNALPLASSSIDFIVSEDGLMLNTGVWFIRRSVWSLGWLQRIYGVDVGVVNSSLNVSSTLFPFDSINTITGGEGISLITPSMISEALKRMLSNESRTMLTNNRMWEQGGALWQFVNREVPYAAKEEARSLKKNLFDARNARCQNNQDSRLDDKHSSRCTLIAYEDVLHTQFVPQEWINSYPEAISGVLRDHKGAPMHASYQPDDWLVSFSGCKGYFGELPCEDMYAAFGKAGVGGSE